MIDYKQKYIESSAEVNDQAAGGSTEDHGQADEKLEGDQDTEAARRPNQRIGEIIRELKQNQPSSQPSADDL
jgi:hypothetical protein